MLNKGDTVRFLNAVGGGVVTRIDEKKGLVYVEDTDGFEVPALIRECVVVPQVGKDTNVPVRDFRKVTTASPSSSSPDPLLDFPYKGKKAEDDECGGNVKLVSPLNDMSRITVEMPEPVEIYETDEGEMLKVLLAFFPEDIKQLQTTPYECYLINDSNYFLYYNIVTGQDEARKSVAHGTIEPNMQEWLLDVAKGDLNDWEHVRVQVLAFKQNKDYTPQPVIDEQLKLDLVRFYKLHSFTENDYSEEPALLLDITEKKKEKAEKVALAAVSPEAIKEAMMAKKIILKPKIVQKRPYKAEIIEIDLHSGELLDTTAGLSGADILQYQMDKFHAVLDEQKNKRGQRIVFIHGKGDGVLRKEIETELKTRYKTYYFQDASFREYGYGATMVMIR